MKAVLPPKIQLVAIDPTFVNAAKQEFEQFGALVEVSRGSIQDMPYEGVAFVSPSNSLLVMDGGLDFIYSRIMFPGVEHTAQTMVRSIGQVTSLGRHYLSVGSAIVVPVQGATSCLICAPTMFLPHDVSRTNNAYHAFMASLCAFSKYAQSGRSRVPLKSMVCPALCCGYGKMTPATSAKQMARALADFLKGAWPDQVKCADDPGCYLAEPRDSEQPDNSDNREIKDIPVYSLLR